jgi:hypothetical protein
MNDGRPDPVVHLEHLALQLGAAVLREPREGPAGWRSMIAAPACGSSGSGSPRR